MESLAKRLKDMGYCPSRDERVERKEIPRVISEIMGSRKQFIVLPYSVWAEDSSVRKDIYKILVKSID